MDGKKTENEPSPSVVERECRPACDVDFEYGMERDLKLKNFQTRSFLLSIFIRKRETFVDNLVFKMVSVGFFCENAPIAV